MIYHGDAIQILKTLPKESIQLCFMSPSPAFYNVPDGTNLIGSELKTNDYVNNLINLCREVYRVLKPSGSLFVHLSDPHNDDNLLGIPETFLYKILHFCLVYL